MGSMEKFLGKAKRVQLNGQDVDIWPLQFDDVDLIIKLGDKDASVRASATKDMLRRALKKSFPDATDADVTNFNLKFMNEFLNAIFEASGLETLTGKKLEPMTAP